MSLHSKKFFVVIVVCLLAVNASAQDTGDKTTVGPLPNANQLRWQDMEMYAFIHYSLNPYTDQEWGYGNEDPQLFNPSLNTTETPIYKGINESEVFCKHLTQHLTQHLTFFIVRDYTPVTIPWIYVLRMWMPVLLSPPQGMMRSANFLVGSMNCSCMGFSTFS